MSSLLDKILADIPELKRAENREFVMSGDPKFDKWQILDTEKETFLLGIIGTAAGRDFSRMGYSSKTAIVSYKSGHFCLCHYEEYAPQTITGFLNTQTNHAIVTRLEEFDDTVSERFGTDDIYIIDYETGVTKALEPYHFDIGAYIGGNLHLTINRTRNWIAFARDEVDGWGPKSRSVAFVFDLTDMELIANSELPNVSSLNSLALPGVGQYMVVTDGARSDHVFRVDNGQLVPVDDQQNQKQLWRWQIALSFAGEDRSVAEHLAYRLKALGISVFFDQFEKPLLLGKDLYQYLFEVYSQHAQYCLVLISKHYVEKAWTMHELKAMQAKTLNSKEEYILPIRLDHTDLPGLAPQIGYLDIQKESLDSIAEIVVEKTNPRRLNPS